MKKIQFKKFTLFIRFEYNPEVKKEISLPFYPKAWRKHPLYDSSFEKEIGLIALSFGLPANAKPSYLSLI